MRQVEITYDALQAIKGAISMGVADPIIEKLFTGVTMGPAAKPMVITLEVAGEIRKEVIGFVNCGCGSVNPRHEGESIIKCRGCGINTHILTKG